MAELLVWRSLALRPRIPSLNNIRLFRPFSACHVSLEKPLPPRPKIIETEIEESFLKGSGPGGQKINKTSSAVQIKHLPTGIVVKSQETRSREQNRKLARQLLAEKLDWLAKGDQSRTAIKTKKAQAKKASKDKKARRKYRKLADEKNDASQTEGDHAGTMDEHIETHQFSQTQHAETKE